MTETMENHLQTNQLHRGWGTEGQEAFPKEGDVVQEQEADLRVKWQNSPRNSHRRHKRCTRHQAGVSGIILGEKNVEALQQKENHVQRNHLPLLVFSCLFSAVLGKTQQWGHSS